MHHIFLFHSIPFLSFPSHLISISISISISVSLSLHVLSLSLCPLYYPLPFTLLPSVRVSYCIFSCILFFFLFLCVFAHAHMHACNLLAFTFTHTHTHIHTRQPGHVSCLMSHAYSPHVHANVFVPGLALHHATPRVSIFTTVYLTSLHLTFLFYFFTIYQLVRSVKSSHTSPLFLPFAAWVSE